MSEEIIVGSVSVEVVPSARGFAAKVDAEVSPEAAALGRKVGESFGREFAAPAVEIIRKAVDGALRGSGSKGTREGADFGGSFARAARERIAAGLEALPKAKVGTDATELDAELVAIRARLSALGDVRIGVDLDAGAALVEVQAVRARLEELGARSPHIDVKVDAAAAVAELTAIEVLAKKVGSTSVNISSGGGGNLGSSTGALSSLASGLTASSIAAGVFALAMVPVAGAILGVVGAAGLLATVLVSAVAAFAIGLAPIIKAVSALNAADKQSAATAVSSAATRASAAQAVQSATASLANATANADSASIRSAEAVAGARQSLADVQRSSARAITSALREQASAEGALTVALRSQREAQEAVTQARKDAQQQIDDLNRAVKGGALDARQASLDIDEARQHLQEVNADPLATSTDRQQAKLNYDQAVQRLDDITARNTTLAATTADANKRGVDGAQGVLDAQQRLADAISASADAQQRVADASTRLSDARLTAAEQIATAEQGITDALRAQTDQARQSAFAISQAQAGLASAGRQQAAATADVTTAAGKAKAALAGLSPAAQTFVTFLRGTFLPALKNVQAAATDGLLGGLTTGLTAILPALPAIAAGFGILAKAAGDLFASAALALGSPFWVSFFAFIASIAGPALHAFGGIVGDIAKGFAGLLRAFAPFAAQLADGISNLAGKFADFGNSAGKGGSLDKFLTFLTEKGPGIARDLGDVAKGIGAFLVATAPLGLAILDELGQVGRFLSAIAPVVRAVSDSLAAQAKAIQDGRHLIAVAFADVLKIAKGVVDFFSKGDWKAVAAKVVAPFAGAVISVRDAFDDVKGLALGARDYITGRFDFLVGYFSGLGPRILTAAGGAFQPLLDVAKAVVDLIQKAWDKLDFSLPDIPGLGTVGDLLHGAGTLLGVPHLASGGIVPATPGGQLILAGEAGEDEFVIPRSDLTRVLATVGSSRATAGASASSNQKGGMVIEHFEQKVYNPLPERPSESAAVTMRRLQWTS